MSLNYDNINKFHNIGCQNYFYNFNMTMKSMNNMNMMSAIGMNQMNMMNNSIVNSKNNNNFMNFSKMESIISENPHLFINNEIL